MPTLLSNNIKCLLTINDLVYESLLNFKFLDNRRTFCENI